MPAFRWKNASQACVWTCRYEANSTSILKIGIKTRAVVVDVSSGAFRCVCSSVRTFAQILKYNFICTFCTYFCRDGSIQFRCNCNQKFWVLVNYLVYSDSKIRKAELLLNSPGHKMSSYHLICFQNMIASLYMRALALATRSPSMSRTCKALQMALLLRSGFVSGGLQSTDGIEWDGSDSFYNQQWRCFSTFSSAQMIISFNSFYIFHTITTIFLFYDGLEHNGCSADTLRQYGIDM